MPRSRHLQNFSLLLVLVAAATPAAAQPVSKALSAQLFEPAVGTRDTLLTLEGATVTHHLGFGLGLMLNYQNDPLVLYVKSAPDGSDEFDLEDADRRINLIKHQLTANLYGVFGFRLKWLRAHVGLSLPVNLSLRGREVGAEGQDLGAFEGEGIGDLRLIPKAMLFSDLAGFSLAFLPILTLPTACWSAAGGLSDCKSDGNLAGDRHVSFRPRLAAHYRYRDLIVVANVGGIFRKRSQVFSSELRHRLTYGVGAGYALHPRVEAMAELFGQAGFGTKSGCEVDAGGATVCSGTSSSDLDAFPLELDFGAHVRLPKGLQATAAVGFGLVKALGSPDFRLIAGLRWAPDWRDADGDGVSDAEDTCPTQPEDRDGFEDGDGCPETDNDEDLIPDTADKCPNEAEDFDQYQDQDGCPEVDNDGDGIADLRDHCPSEPETVNQYDDEDGCPDVPDADKDGIADADDRCVREAEDADGFQDEDGCPDPDNDADGVPDTYDNCPTAREDIDNFDDEDGCPDPDNDQDGVLDANDQCPNEKEVINGVDDEDGCPDKGKQQVEIKKDKIVITKKVYFDTGKATLRKRSDSILNQVGLTLLANPEVKRVRIEGHTDSRGKPERNKELSQLRAAAVRDYLVKRGVQPERLESVGLGPDQPIADNRTLAGRAANRRVDFVIVERAAATQEPAVEASSSEQAPASEDSPE
jgi:outer membrane protein OmpA-like peptidoglycan-associated protein